MHTNIIPHSYFLTEDCMNEFDAITFVLYQWTVQRRNEIVLVSKSYIPQPFRLTDSARVFFCTFFHQIHMVEGSAFSFSAPGSIYHSIFMKEDSQVAEWSAGRPPWVLSEKEK